MRLSMDLKELEDEIDRFVAEISTSRKYRSMMICEDTIRHLIARELMHCRKKGEANKAARKKLHEVIAPYLGDPNFEKAKEGLSRAFQTHNREEIQRVCAEVMSAHVSTRERLPILDEFYQRLFAITGKPASIIDVACGLHPLSFPWMRLPLSTRVVAFDLNQRRIELLTYYFSLQRLSGTAKTQDILINFPTEEADVALIFKEVPRFERRQHGSSLSLFDALRVRYLAVSVPTRNLEGRHSLTAGYRKLFYKIIEGRPWTVQEIEFPSELVFVADKQPYR